MCRINKAWRNETVGEQIKVDSGNTGFGEDAGLTIACNYRRISLLDICNEIFTN